VSLASYYSCAALHTCIACSAFVTCVLCGIVKLPSCFCAAKPAMQLPVVGFDSDDHKKECYQRS